MASNPAIILSIAAGVSGFICKEEKKSGRKKEGKERKLIPLHKHHISIVSFKKLITFTHVAYKQRCVFVGKPCAEAKLDWKCFIPGIWRKLP